MSTVLVCALFLTCRASAQEPPGSRQDLPAAETYQFEALVATWSPAANVVVSSDAPGVTGTRIDLRSDLGLVDRRFPELQFTWRPALKHKFRFQYIPIHFDSAATPPRDLIFNGVTYPAGLPTTASLDWTTYRFGYEFDFIVKRRGSVGFIAEVKHTVVRAELRSAAADEVSRQAMPVPALGGFARVYPTPRLALTGEVTFFGVPDRPTGTMVGISPTSICPPSGTSPDISARKPDSEILTSIIWVSGTRPRSR